MARNLGLYAGGDWSGKPDKPSGLSDIFSFAVVMTEDLEAAEEEFALLKRRLGMKADKEFHGHEMNDTQNAAVLELILHQEMRIGILMINKSAVPLTRQITLPTGPRFTHEVAMRLFELFVPGCPLSRVWLDEDIKGKATQQLFKTDVQRVCRTHHPASTCKVVFRGSHTSLMIQLADVVAYVLSRQARGVRFYPPLESVLRKLRSDSRHLILGPLPWEE